MRRVRGLPFLQNFLATETASVSLDVCVSMQLWLFYLLHPVNGIIEFVIYCLNGQPTEDVDEPAFNSYTRDLEFQLKNN